MSNGTINRPPDNTYKLMSGSVYTKDDLHNHIIDALQNYSTNDVIHVYFTTGSGTGLDTTIYTPYAYYFGTIAKPSSASYSALFSNIAGEIISIGAYSNMSVVAGWSSKKGGSF